MFHTKRTADGSIEQYKARLVAQGFSQRPRWDFVLERIKSMVFDPLLTDSVTATDSL